MWNWWSLVQASMHYNDVIMGMMASQITSLTVVYSTVYSDANQRKISKLRVPGLCVGNSPGPVREFTGTGEFPAHRASNAEMFPFDDVIMVLITMAMMTWTTSNHRIDMCWSVSYSFILLQRSSYVTEYFFQITPLIKHNWLWLWLDACVNGYSLSITYRLVPLIITSTT